LSMNDNTVNSWLSRLIKGRRRTNNNKTWIVQNISSGAFTKHHNYFTFFKQLTLILRNSVQWWLLVFVNYLDSSRLYVLSWQL
jgi:hypothetical protein